MLRSVPKQTTIPDPLTASKVNLLNRMPTKMYDTYRRTKPDRATCRRQAPAEIDVFKPDRIEPFVEPTQTLPINAAEEETSSRWLFDDLRLQRVDIQTAVPPVDRIARPDPVYPKHFKCQCYSCRKTAKTKAFLRRAVWIRQQGGSGIVSICTQCVD